VSPPTVSIVIPNWNGAAHLRNCLDSLETLEYLHERVETIIVDNGSEDESRALVEDGYPGVRLIELDENVGFAAACNAGARAASHDCIAFLNNDMRVEPRWLTALVDRYDPRAGYVCVAGVILDWEGERIDFAGGWVNFHGFAGQMHQGKALDERLIEDGSDLLFACGGSMLIDRKVFLGLGGFDPAYFAYFEDVDLGWRLWLSGYKVRLAGLARTFHRSHGSGLPLHRRLFLCERNALFTLIKNLDDRNLPQLLTAALFLLVKRSALRMESDREEGRASLTAAAEVLANLTEVLERRREVQARRTREDREVFELFRWPFARITGDVDYAKATEDLRTAFRLDELFAPRVLRARHRLTRRSLRRPAPGGSSLG
jgi:GT2 family glycosyltransferase